MKFKARHFLDHLRSIVVAGAIALVMPPLPSRADTMVASWNIRNLGWGEKKDFDALAEVGSHFDLIAVQEVMTEQGAEQMRSALNERTGADWQLLLSHNVGRGTYTEMYAFLFRPEAVEWVGGAVVYIDDRDRFEREPFSAVFRTADGFSFVLASVHLIYGDTVTRRQDEARALGEYRSWLEQSFPDLPVFISGDFNLPPSDPAWAEQGSTSWPLIIEGATTLGKRDGRYANLYDNIWAPSGITLPVASWGILPFPSSVLNMSHERARETVSDHAPVWMHLDPTQPPIVFEAWMDPPETSGIATQQDALMPMEASVIGNRNSNIYHLPHCPGFSKISERNRMPFASEKEALSSGFRKAANC